MKIQNIDPVLNNIAGFNFHNKSKFDFEKLKADPNNIAANVNNYINGFSASAREIIDYFNFNEQIAKLDEADLLYMIVKRFGEVDSRSSFNIILSSFFLLSAVQTSRLWICLR